MAVKHFQIGRGTYDKAIVYTGLVGELILDTTNMQVRVHDGETMGGYPIAKDVLATSSARGLMAPEDKAKLDTLQNYVLPTAGLNKLGGVKTTSTVTSASGYTACPIISGVPYYANNPVVSLYVGAVDAKADAATSNGATYLKLFSDNTLSKQFNIKGSGATTVTSDASGSLIINSVNTTYTAATNAPLAAGTAAVGTSAKYAREDHVHPAQTTISGNAGTATKLANGAKIGISGAVTGTATLFDGSTNITIPTTGIDVSKANAGTLPVARGGTGQTSVANIQAGKDAAGNVITETYATKTEVNNLRSGLVQTVPALPETGTEGIIYLVPNTTDPNTYDQFTWENGAYVPLGNTSFNLGDYVKKENVVTSLTISGRTITYTKGDGTTGTLTTQDNNTTYSAGTGLSLSGTTFSVSSTAGTSALAWNSEVTLGTVGGLAIKAKLPANPNSDTKVTQNISTTDKTYPVLLTPTADANANVGASTAIFGAGIKANPSTGELIATKFTGALAGNANTATKATQDSAGQQINTTYIKGLSVSGKTITYTKGDGTTGTITTQDTNTTYGVATTSANGLMSADDKAKLDGLSNYVLPTAANGILGGVKTTSTVTSASGYTACPIINGVPYYKDTNTTYTLSSLGIGNVKNYDQSKAISSITRSGTTFTYTCLDGTTGTFTQQDNNTWTAFKGATADAAGTAGYVPAPAKGDQAKFFRADGTWQTPPNTTYSNFVKSGSGAKAGLVPAPSTTAGSTKYLREDGTWTVPPNTTYTFTAGTSTLAWNSEVTLATVGGLAIKAKLPANPNVWTAFKGATSSAAGTAGYVPAPAKGDQAKYFRADGTWQTPPNTTYSNFVKSGSGAKAGLVPAPSTTAGTTKYLREDGTWQVPPDTNTTYTFTAGTSALAWNSEVTLATVGGLAIKAKLPANPNTNTTYSAGTGLTLSGTTFSVAANTYAAANHTHSYLPLSGGTVTGQLTVNRDNGAVGGGIKLTGAGQNFAISIIDTGITKGTAPTSTRYTGIDFYGKTMDSYRNRLGMIEYGLDANNTSSIYLRAYNCTSAENAATSTISAHVDGSGNAYTAAPTPAANDNSTKIATTAWVQTFCGTTKKYLTSHQSLSNYSTLANTIKALSVSGRTITYTKGDGTTGTITTQDTNTTYSNFVKSGSGAKAGLVPAPSTTAGTTHYLREDGTWQVPPNTTYSFTAGTSTLAWNSEVTLATVGGLAIKAKLPANPNTDTKYSAGTGLTLSGTTFSVASNLNAATATKLANARTIALSGAITGSKAFDGSGNITIPTSLKTCYAVVEGEAVTNNIFKFATVDLGGAYNIYNFYILIQCSHNLSSALWNIGFGASKTAGVLDWGLSTLVNNIDLDPANFFVAYKNNSGGNINIALYCKIAERYKGYRFTVISEVKRAGIGDGSAAYLILINKTKDQGTAAVDSGYTVINTTNATVQGNLAGNSATATKATQDSAGQQINKTYIKGLSVNGKTITYTKGDGTTGTITTQDTNTTYTFTAGTSALAWNSEVTLATVGGLAIKAKLPANPNVWTAFKGATSSAAGTAGYVPAPAKGDQAKFFRADGTWQTPPNTTYSNFVKSGSGAKAGLVPAPSTTAGSTKYLREDGTWQVPPNTNTTYSAGTGLSLSGTTFSVKANTYAAYSHTHNYMPLAQSGMNSWSFIKSNSAMNSGSMSSAVSMAIAMVASNSDATTNLISGKKIGGVGMYASGESKMSGLKVTYYEAAATAHEAGFDMFTTGSINSHTQKVSVLFRHGGKGEVFGPSPSWSSALSANEDTGTVLLGSTHYLWKQVCAKTSSIATSDERLKTQIAPIPDEILDAWEDLQYSQFKWIDTVEQEGEAARLHVGAVAQAVERMFQSKGIDVTKYSFFCHTPEEPYEWTEEVEVEPGVKEERVVKGVHPDRYALRYVDMLVIEAAYQRRRADRLEARLARIEKVLNLD